MGRDGLLFFSCRELAITFWCHGSNMFIYENMIKFCSFISFFSFQVGGLQQTQEVSMALPQQHSLSQQILVNDQKRRNGERLRMMIVSSLVHASRFALHSSLFSPLMRNFSFSSLSLAFRLPPTVFPSSCLSHFPSLLRISLSSSFALFLVSLSLTRFLLSPLPPFRTPATQATQLRLYAKDKI